MITGLRAIWKGTGNKFFVTLFALLSALSVLLSFPMGRELYFLLSTALFAGVILFLSLALLALIPQFNKLLRPVERSDATRSTAFLVTALLAVFVYSLPLRFDHMLAYGGFLLWLVVQALLSCSLAYSLSERLSSHRPRVLGWLFLALALVAEVLVYLWIRNIHVIYPLFAFYSVAWFTPCVILAFMNYRNAESFSAYCLIALIYTIFPVAYRIFALLDDLAVKSGGPPLFIGKLLIDELLTIAFFIWALNGIGKFFVKMQAKTRTGEQPLVSNPPDSSYEQQERPSNVTEPSNGPVRRSGSTMRKEPMLGLFLTFGLLFSALAYFVFVNAAKPLGIPDYLESTTAYALSILATVPLLFYMGLRKNKSS